MKAALRLALAAPVLAATVSAGCSAHRVAVVDPGLGQHQESLQHIRTPAWPTYLPSSNEAMQVRFAHPPSWPVYAPGFVSSMGNIGAELTGNRSTPRLVRIFNANRCKRSEELLGPTGVLVDWGANVSAEILPVGARPGPGMKLTVNGHQASVQSEPASPVCPDRGISGEIQVSKSVLLFMHATFGPRAPKDADAVAMAIFRSATWR